MMDDVAFLLNAATVFNSGIRRFERSSMHSMSIYAAQTFLIKSIVYANMRYYLYAFNFDVTVCAPGRDRGRTLSTPGWRGAAVAVVPAASHAAYLPEGSKWHRCGQSGFHAQTAKSCPQLNRAIAACASSRRCLGLRWILLDSRLSLEMKPLWIWPNLPNQL